MGYVLVTPINGLLNVHRNVMLLYRSFATDVLSPIEMHSFLLHSIVPRCDESKKLIKLHRCNYDSFLYKTKSQSTKQCESVTALIVSASGLN